MQLSKQLAAVAARVRKHLGASTLALKVWERTSEELLTRCEQPRPRVRLLSSATQGWKFWVPGCSRPHPPALGPLAHSGSVAEDGGSLLWIA